MTVALSTPLRRNNSAAAGREVLTAPDIAAGAPEFALSDSDFARVRKLIYQRAGINLQDGKQAMVYGRLSRRLRETEHLSFGSYLDSLEALSGTSANGEWQLFINCLTTNLTSFFREPHHFTALHEVLQKRRSSTTRIWCSAASTGEEPYSLAITALDALDARAQVSILCTDIDTNVLSSAERGVYAADARGLSPVQLRRHFMRGTNANSGFIRARPELQGLLEFKAFNLISGALDGLGEPFDIVFCRNVMIYFDAATQRKVLERIHTRMRPKSLLFVGHSENFSESRDLFELRGKTIYHRV